MKRIVYSFGAIMGSFIGILLIAPYFIDINHYKEKIITEAKKTIGRELFLKGPLSFSLFPSPSVTLRQVMLENHPKAKTPHIAILEKVKVSVAIIPLFQRKIHISKIEIKNPKFELEKLPKEKMNWDIITQKNASTLHSSSLKNSDDTSPFRFIPTIDEIRITNAQVTYRNGKDIFLIENFGLKIGMKSLEGPYVAKGKFRLHNRRFEFRLNVGEVNELQPIEAQVGLARSRLKLDGVYQFGKQTFKGILKGQVYLKSFKSLVPAWTLPQDLNHKISLDSVISADTKALILKDLYLDLQSLKVGGDLSMIFEKNIIVKAQLHDLPGQGKISFTLEPQPQGITGTTHIQFQELKSFLNWLQIPVQDVPSHLLDTCKFSMKYALLENLIKLTKIDLLLKEASLTGEIHYKLNEIIPTIMINLKTPKLENFLPTNHRRIRSPLGTGTAQGHLRGGSKALHFDMNLSLGNLTLVTKGEATGLDKDPYLRVEVNGKIANLNSFLNALGIKTKIASVYASLKGQVSGVLNNLTINTRATLGGLVLKSSGVLKNIMTLPVFNVNVDLSHHNFGNFLSIFNISSPSAQGGATFSTNVNGDIDSFKIEDIKAKLGFKNDFKGFIEIDYKQNKPIVIGKLTSSSLNLDSFITQAAIPQDLREPESFFSFLLSDSKPRKDHAWSRDPISFNVLKDLNADIDFSIAKLCHKDIVITNLNFLAKIQDDILNIAPVTGNIYGGNLDASFQLTSKNAAEGKFELKQAHLSHLNPSGNTFKIIGGKFSLSAELKTKGHNLHDIVARLGGQIKMRAKDGVIAGFDLKAISQRLKEVNSIPSLLNLLTMSMSKGKTTFRNFKSDIYFKNGIGTIQCMELIGYGVTSKAKGDLDLLKYALNVDLECRLTEHPYLPPFFMYITGPLNDPKRELETDALQQYLLKNVFNGMLEDVIKGPSKLVNMLGNIF